MATYSVYDNILIKLENVYLRVEMEVDKEITTLSNNHLTLNRQLTDLRGKIEILNALKRSFELYCNDEDEMKRLHQSLFKVLCDKQIQLRMLQEKELLLSSYLVLSPETTLPTVMQINKEFKLRKYLQEIELLASFLSEDLRFESFVNEIERANEMFDLAIESGAIDKLENVVSLFQNFFEKVLHMYEIDPSLINEFKDFRSQILVQADNISLFVPQDVESIHNMQKSHKTVRDERMRLEQEVDRLLYQYTMFQSGRKTIFAEIRHSGGELESIIFKEYAIKQKIQELRQYKVDLNNQKDDFMKDPTLDGYTEAVQQLEHVENRFRRLMMHKNFEKQTLVSRFFAANKVKTEHQFRTEEQTPYHKVLFQVLHNNHISSQDKLIILRLSKPSKLINTLSGKLFYQRTGKTRSLQTLEESFLKLQTSELH